MRNLATIAALVATAALSACSAGDQGGWVYQDDGTSATADGSSGGGGTEGGATTGSGTGTGTGTGTDGGPGGGHDSGSGGNDASSPPPAGVFAGAPAYSAQSGGSGHHNAGRNCEQCHGLGAPLFDIGGTVYSASGAALSGVEVRVVDSTGTAFSVYSGYNGNFYQNAAGSGLRTPAHVGARNASGTVNMVAACTTGACNSCHCTGCSTAPIHVP